MNAFTLRLAGVLLAATIAGPMAASAQNAPLATESFKPGAAAAPPAASASHLAAARELVVASGLSRAYGGVIPELMMKINMTFGPTRPEISNDLKATLDQLQPEFMAYTRDLLDFGARVYASVMSEQECKDALAFFNSPVGKKYVDSQPAIIANMGPALNDWSKAVSVQMLNRVRAEMKKKGHEL